MFKWTVLAILAIAVFLFISSLGAGIGFASAGGDVRILSSWSEANSNEGQAIAIYGNDSEIVTGNEPIPNQTVRYSRTWSIIPMFGLFLFMAFSLYKLLATIKPETEVEEETNYTHHSGKEAKEWAKYGQENQ